MEMCLDFSLSQIRFSTPWERMITVLRPKNHGPPLFDVPDDFLVVDDGAVGVDLSPVLPGQLPIYRVHGTLHAETEAGGFC